MQYLHRLMTEQERTVSLATNPRKLVAPGGGSCCDFCGAASPVYIYAADRTSTGETVRCWRWCACPPCAEAVSSESWAILAERTLVALRTLPGYVGPDDDRVLRRVIESLYQDFRNHAIPDPWSP